jgi:hypothetical protein
LVFGHVVDDCDPPRSAIPHCSTHSRLNMRRTRVSNS